MQYIAEYSGFTIVFDSILKKHGYMTALVFGGVYRYCQMRDGYCTASQTRIGNDLGITRKTVNDHLEILVNDGYLKKEVRPGETDMYFDTGKAKLVTVSYNAEDGNLCNKVTPPVTLGYTSNTINNTINNDETKKELKTITDEDLEQFVEYSKTIGKAKPEKKVSKYSLSKKDYSDADSAVFDIIKNSDKAKKNTQTLLPEQFQEQAKWFMVHTGLSYMPKFRSLWIEGFEEWNNLGAIEDDVKKAVDKLQSAGFSIVSPGSLTKTLNGIVANRKKDSGSYNPWR